MLPILHSSLILFLSLIHFFVSAEGHSSSRISRNSYNIILISVDTVRADHLGCYGYFRNTSPNIDKLAKEGILFEQAISQSNWTLPAHASLFTAEYPMIHNVHFFNQLAPSELTLAEILSDYGYKTAAFTGGDHLMRKFGIAQGFDVYYDKGSWDSPLGWFSNTVPLAINWLKENKQDKFFLFLHGYDAHGPYNSPPDQNMFDEGYKGKLDEMKWDYFRIFLTFYFTENGQIMKLTRKDVDHIIAQYDAGVFHADNSIGIFLKYIAQEHLFDNTIIILISDHGEELFDHGAVMSHGATYYDEMLRVPLIIRHPQVRGPMRIKPQAQLIDVMPTILDFLGIPKNKEAQGNSLVPLIEGTAPTDFNEYVYSGTNVVRSHRWKAIGKNELYDLEKDPKEQYNIANKNPAILIRLNLEFLKQKKKNIELRKSKDVDNKNVAYMENDYGYR